MTKRHSPGIDTLYSKQLQAVQDFAFDRNVADVFDNMVVRSVPFYKELQRMMVQLAARFVQKGTNVYDLGCATGTTLCMMSRAIRDQTVRFPGLDSSIDMIKKAKRKVARLGDTRITFVLQDLNLPFELVKPSVVIMAFTLQFLKPVRRRSLVQSVHDSLMPNGCFILSEKVLGADSMMTRVMNDFYCDFKRRNRYSELEIAQKRQALENVLVPYRLEEYIRLLHECGFPVVDVFFKWSNFSGLVAVKARP